MHREKRVNYFIRGVRGKPLWGIDIWAETQEKSKQKLHTDPWSKTTIPNTGRARARLPRLLPLPVGCGRTMNTCIGRLSLSFPLGSSFASLFINYLFRCHISFLLGERALHQESENPGMVLTRSVATPTGDSVLPATPFVISWALTKHSRSHSSLAVE